MSDPVLPARRRRSPLRMVLMVAGLAAMVAGVGLVAGPLLGVFQRGHADQTALSTWQGGGSVPLPGAVKGGATASKTVACGSASSSDFALVSFSAPAADHYAGVATDGTWDQLYNRSMVHYTGTPAPGAQGNSIIAFHREPDFEHIDRLGKGDTVTVQDRTCHSFVYQITGRWVLNPSDVSQLAPTSGHDLTLITCTPFWVDSQRIVWRATLVSPTS